MPVYTIGYGNRAITDFLDLLKRYGVSALVDVRSMPTSRFQPYFRKKALQQQLEGVGIRYWYLGDVLGGKRVEPDCLVDGVVDLECLYGKETFQAAIGELVLAAQNGETLALMCAELRPQACHRHGMLTPPLEKVGLEVLHIDEKGQLKTSAEVRQAPPPVWNQPG